MNKNRPVFKVLVDEKTLRFTKVLDTYDLEYLPYQVQHTDNDLSLADFEHWFFHRKQPEFRQDLDYVLDSLNISRIEEIMFKNYALNVIDHYWLKPVDAEVKWEDINYFYNPINTDLGKVIFKLADDVDSYESADMLTDGWLAKSWTKRDGEVVLLKNGSNEYDQEIPNEIFASRVAELLGFDYVPFSKEKLADFYVSTCKNIVDKDTELVKIREFTYHDDIWDKEDSFERLIALIEAVGIKDARERIEDILVLDYIILNQDRHLRNFALIRDADSLEFLKVAPIYDSGASMFLGIKDEEIETHIPHAQPFKPSFDEQIKLVNLDRYDFSVLDNIEDEVYKIYTGSYMDELNPHRKDILAKKVRERVDKLISLQN